MSETTTCSTCGRERTLRDAYDYNPLQVVTGQRLGWYSGDDGEFCPGCMTKMLTQESELTDLSPERGDELCDLCDGTGRNIQGWTNKGGEPENQYGPCPNCSQVGGDLAEAIIRVEKSRQTHVEWLSYWQEFENHVCTAEPCPWEHAREATAAIAGDAEHQQECIRGYDNVLAVLRAVGTCRAALTNPTEEQR